MIKPMNRDAQKLNWWLEGNKYSSINPQTPLQKAITAKAMMTANKVCFTGFILFSLLNTLVLVLLDI